MKTTRDSNIELLRLLSQWMIVLYHILAFLVFYRQKDVSEIYRALWLPLHVGVPIFILISGYFRIKFKVKGIIRLLSVMFIYTVPIGLLECHWEGSGGGKIVETLLFVSNTPFWFMRTYMCLYLLSPLLNFLLDQSDFLNLSGNKIKFVALLGIVAIYFGLTHFDDSLNSGKNVVNFSLIYILGAYLHKYKPTFERIGTSKLVVLLLGINITQLSLYLLFADSLIGRAFHYVCFMYCSPLLIFNAILIFLIFSRIVFKSKLVNYLSASSISIYLIHLNHYVFYDILGTYVDSLFQMQFSVIANLLLLAFIAIIMCAVCITI